MSYSYEPYLSTTNLRIFFLRHRYHLQILIYPIILPVEGEVHQFEAVGELEHGVVGDGTAALAVEAGGVQIDLDLGHHINVGGTGKLAA